ncbi:methylmalonyl Co-A mutase-associated GTPase MeaB [Sulfuritalea sp.]|uniref:methylmalonyl Co-A mutase-associated GTPase MeaB n=1 Tax=Sulfuritalea sp. TaxID=2480090 RepID=UPI001AD2FDCF|nr:methylmalonyl Co-A mutase-associated GTPase MeaB [Sulfuritalea sp.]MBN8473758.1 methylmalonyl Co-A mutase-associated GTPase MeaB [Sulfuritalea sp.]
MDFSLEQLACNIAAGQRPALARALSLAERDPASAAALLAALADRLGRAHVIGITGPPGAGKSTLVGVLARQLLAAGHRVAVLAVDPSSPVTGGALLGDRFRIGETAGDDRCFVRSTATRGSLGGLTGAAGQMVRLMDAAGFDLVLVETVGTGQSEIDVAQLADSLLVVFPPGLGDELQAIKAGILELADLLVVSKSDAPGAKQACQALQGVAPLWRKAPTIHPVSALSGEGIAELVAAVLDRARDGRSSARPPAAAPALREALAIMRCEMDRHLPFLPAAGLTIRLPDMEPNGGSLTLEVELDAAAAGDRYALGTAVGALVVLAADAGLDCGVVPATAANGTVRMVLTRR